MGLKPSDLTTGVLYATPQVGPEPSPGIQKLGFKSQWSHSAIMGLVS